jgi:site-specific recombinase XerD
LTRLRASAAGVLFIRELSRIQADEIMATLKIEPGTDGRVWVSLTYYSVEDLARMKRIPGRQWNPERKQWSLPDNAVTRKALAEMVAAPPAPPPKFIAVKPKDPNVAAAPQEKRKRYVPGRDKPLTTNPPHPLIKRVDNELVLRGMAYGTRKSYGQHLRNYFEWLKGRAKGQPIAPEKATADDIREYLAQMASSGQVSPGYCRGARAVLVTLYETILKQPGRVADLPRMKRPKQLPIVLSAEEIVRIIKVTRNLKHKALLTTAYGAGLRVGEVVRLKRGDVDFDRMQVRVTAGKGAKDRYTLLARIAAKSLLEYIAAFKPQLWLFPGDDSTDHLSERAAQHVFEDAKKRAGITKKVTFHSLRHSFATHLHESGVGLRYIQELMGHDSIETTERYTHVTPEGKERIESPLDKLKL